MSYSWKPQSGGNHANLVDHDRKLFVNCVIGLRLVEERKNIFKWCVGRQFTVEVSLDQKIQYILKSVLS